MWLQEKHTRAVRALSCQGAYGTRRFLEAVNQTPIRWNRRYPRSIFRAFCGFRGQCITSVYKSTRMALTVFLLRPGRVAVASRSLFSQLRLSCSK